MDKKSTNLIVVFIVIVVISITVIFYRYIVIEDINFDTNEEAFQESLLEEE